MRSKPKRTYRVLYDALAKLTNYEEVALAEAHARDPRDFLSRFKISLAEAAVRPVEVHQPFHDREDEGLPPPGNVHEIGSTKKFASHLADGKPRVVGDDEFQFRYLDRELFLGRTSAPSARVAARSLDLLLIDGAGTPIIGELKRWPDRLPYYALVQVMMHAVEACVPDQRRRLERHYGARGLSFPKSGPGVDLYLISYGPADGASYYKASLQATKTVSEACLAHPLIGSYVRRIEFLDAIPVDNQLEFRRTLA